MMAYLRDTTRRRDTVSTITLLARSDLQTAVKHVRKHAGEYRIDTNRVGLIGFSAGAGLALNLISSGTADVKPNFAAINYGVRRAPIKTPVDQKLPLFIAAATDDQLAPVANSIDIFNDWVAAGQSVELHLYAKGGIGLQGVAPHGLNGFPANTWVHRFLDWMESIGFSRGNDSKVAAPAD
jgi:acetyl esterase/lipase